MAKLQSIIRSKNETIERNTLRAAECLIEGIVEQQKRITQAQNQIAELRKELAALEVQQLDASMVLGE